MFRRVMIVLTTASVMVLGTVGPASADIIWGR